MSNKKWLTALIIIGALAIAFFWGGNYPKSSDKPGNSSAEAEVALETTDSAISDDQKTHNPISATDNAEVATPMPTDALKPEATPLPSPSAAVVKPAETAATTHVDKAAETDVPDKSTSTPKKEVVKKPTASKDKFLTEPVPEGQPGPVEWQDTEVDKAQKLTVTLSVSAETVLDHLDTFNKDKLEVLPKDGIIYKAQKVTFYEGESVFDVLLREMKNNKIHMEFNMTPLYNSNYVEGISNIYEFDGGELSGWMFKVNEWFPNYGSSRYLLKDGDVVEWVYTFDLGRDIGGYNDTAGDKE